MASSKNKRGFEPMMGGRTAISSGSMSAASVRMRSVAFNPEAGTSTFSFASADVREVERSFPADGAFVRMRNGSPEVVCVQLDPFDDKRVARAVVARFDRQRFIERAEANEEFRGKLNEHVGAVKREPAPGYFTKLLEAARAHDDAPSALLHAEFDSITFSGGTAWVVFVTMPGAAARALAGRDLSKVRVVAELECGMSTAALADLLAAWKDRADRLKQ